MGPRSGLDRRPIVTASGPVRLRDVTPPTMPSDKVLSLAKTWRLHPDICRFTSELFYEGRLEPQAGVERQNLEGTEPLNGTGVRFIPVKHSGNQSESPEEAEAVAALV